MSWSGCNRRTTKKILFLDDSQDELDMFRITANALGFESKVVKYQSDFISEYETGVYDAAFVDFILSFGDGVMLTRLLHKEKAPKTKLYIFTAYDKDFVKRKCNGDKINGVLNKMDGIPMALAEVVND